MNVFPIGGSPTKLRKSVILAVVVTGWCSEHASSTPLDYSFITPTVIALPNQIIDMEGTVTNNGTIAQTVSGFGFDADTLIGAWNAFPGQPVGSHNGPYQINTPLSPLIFTVNPGQSFNFDFGTLVPRSPSISPATYSARFQLSGPITGSTIFGETKTALIPFTVTVLSPPTIAPNINQFPNASQLAGAFPTLLSENKTSFDQIIYQYLLPVANGLAEFKPELSATANVLSSAGTTYGVASTIFGSLTLRIPPELGALLLSVNFLPSESDKLFINGASTIGSVITALAVDNPLSAAIAANAYIYGDLLPYEMRQFVKSDPPDLSFTQLYSPPIISLPAASTGNPALDQAFDKANNAGINAALDLDGAITSMNRYSSAVAAGDSLSAALQLEALSYYLQAYNVAISEAEAATAALTALLKTLGLLPSAPPPDLLLAMQQVLELNGFDSAELALFREFGFSDADVQSALAALLSLSTGEMEAAGNDMSDIPSFLSEAGLPQTAVPEPSTFLILIGALLFSGFILALRHRANRAAHSIE